MTPPGKKILLVDDDPGIVDAMLLILEDEGYQVHALTDGTQVLTTADEFQPDIILLDILISGTDGRDICRALKHNEQFQHIPVILVSAHPSTKQSALKSQADDFMEKPFDFDVLLKKIEHYTQ